MSAPSINPLFIRIPLIALGLSFATWSAMTGIAALDYFYAKSYLEAWNYQAQLNPAYQTPEADYQNALADARQALQLIPYNSEYHIALADTLAWQVTTSANLPAATRQSLTTEILSHYHIAIKQRPSWPYAYAQLALTKSKLGELDQEMMSALQKANELGPHELDVLHMTISLGLLKWDQLDHTTRLTVVSAIDKSLTWDLDETLNFQESLYALSFIGLYHRQAEICPLLTTKSEQVSNLCRTVTAKPNSTKAHK